MEDQQVALARLRSALPSLSDSERRVALWVLDNPEKTLRQSMSAIAQIVGVSDTTVLRMCRMAGFEGFVDMRLKLARVLNEAVTLDEPEAADGDLSAARKIFAANQQALSDTLAVLKEDCLTEALDLLHDSRHILIGGVGGSGLVAQALYQRCARLGLRSEAPVDSHLQIMHAAVLGPGDLAIAVSYSGVTTDPALMLQEARARGATTMCITGNTRSPLARLADVVMVSVSHESRSEPMAAQIAQFTLVDVLYAAYAARHPEPALTLEERMVNAILPKSH